MASPIAIIAGAGRFPFHIAKEAKRLGLDVIVVGIQGWADASLAAEVRSYTELPVGELGQLIAHVKSQGVRQAIMAGKVTKAVLLSHGTTFDAEARDVLREAGERSVSALLGTIGKRLAREGITLLDSSTFLATSLCPLGVLTSRTPSPPEHADVRLGVRVARPLAALDIGQTVIVKDSVVVAVEALEGTDAAIRRAHVLAGEGLVVVKAASPTQDRRFDLPVIGRETMKTLTECGVSCVAVEAEMTLLLERDALIASANVAGLCLMGVAPLSSCEDG